MKASDPTRINLDTRCEHCPVRHHSICSALDNHGSNALSSIMVHKHFVRGQHIWSEDDDADFFAIVVSGAIKLSKVLADGRQQIVGLLFPSDCLGRTFSEKQQTFAEAATDVELCCFPREKFEQVLKQHPEVEHALFQKTLNDLDGARDWMVTLGLKTAREKLASFLVQMSQRSELSKCAHPRPMPELPTFVLPFTRSEIAEYLGLTIETVSRNFTRLRVDNVIRLIDGHTVEVLDPEMLASMAESKD